MKKLIQIFPLVLFATSLFSAHAIRQENEKYRQKEYEENVDQGYSKSKSYQIANYNKEACIKPAGGKNWWFDASALCLKADQENMLLATKVYTENGTDYTALKNYDLDYNWDFGFRFQVGGNLHTDGWLLSSEYLHFYTKRTDHLHTRDPYYLMIPATFLIGSTYTDNFTDKSKIYMDMIDLLLSRPFYTGRCLILVPSMGLYVGVISQKEYQGFLYTNTEIGFHEAPFNSYLSSKSVGIGPKFALQGKWILKEGFNISIKSAISVLYTHYKLHFNSYYTGLYDGPLYFEFVDNSNKVNLLRPMLENILALSWGRYFNDDNFHLTISLGYEFNIYWNQNMIRNYAIESFYRVSSDYGNLYLQGVNLNMKFDF